MTKSEQARADAIADAETLRRFADDVWRNPDTYCDEASNLPILLEMAKLRKPGSRFIACLHRNQFHTSLFFSAVGAAYRACPGLR